MAVKHQGELHNLLLHMNRDEVIYKGGRIKAALNLEPPKLDMRPAKVGHRGVAS